MTTQFRTAKGTFEIHKCSWGWGVLNIVTGHVDQRKSEQECLELLQSHGPAGQGVSSGGQANHTSGPATDPDDLRPAAPGLCVCGDPADTVLDDIDFPICRACAGVITGEDDHLYPDLDEQN
jgi:hypothetical protein